MQAIALVGFPGTPTLVTVPRPVLSSPTDVLVSVKAVATNPVDRYAKIMMQMFGHQEPLVCGHDAAGVIAQVGTDVKGFKVGDEVYFVSHTCTRAHSHAR